MGCTVRDKHVRANRKNRSAKPESDHSNPSEKAAEVERPVSKSGDSNGFKYGLEAGRVFGGNPNFDENGWAYCTDEELEGLLLRNLEFLYNEAIAALVRAGYEMEAAMRAVLKNGHCYGSMSAFSNIVHNAVTYLNRECGCSDEEGENGEPSFVNLRQLAEYSLGGMVCLLQQMRPQMSRGDALRCLLKGDFHLNRAPPVPQKGDVPPFSDGENGEVNEGNGEGGGGSCEGSEGESGVTSEIGIPPGLCRFHGGWGYGNGKSPEVAGNSSYLNYSLTKEDQCAKRFDLPPPLKSMLKRNVASFAAGLQASTGKLQTQSRPCPSSLSSGDSQTGASALAEACEKRSEEPSNGVKQDVVMSMLNKFQEMKLYENYENIGEIQKLEMIVTLKQQIKELEKQVEERREWAREKAMQAARKLSSDLTELKILRMEREEETQRLNKGKQNLEDSTMKRLSEMESALRKASGQVDRANTAVRRIENENAELRAEMEAAKLSASEYVKTCLEIAKREKKSLKRLLTWEKQKTKMQEEIDAEKKRIADLRQEINQVEQAQKETEGKLKQEIKAKEQALAQMMELRKTKDATEAEYKRRHEALRLKIELDFQRHKDDLQRLEQELSRLKVSANPVSSLSTINSNGEKPQEANIARTLFELHLVEDAASETEEEYMNRACMICLKDEVSVVFLPCAHEVICASCNETYGKKGKAVCPCCRTPIQQRICVFGASS